MVSFPSPRHLLLKRIPHILFHDSPCVVSLQILHYNGVDEYSAKNNVKCIGNVLVLCNVFVSYELDNFLQTFCSLVVRT